MYAIRSYYVGLTGAATEPTKEPRNSEAHYLLAKALEQDGKAELALMELKTVSNINDFKGYCKENEFRPRLRNNFV